MGIRVLICVSVPVMAVGMRAALESIGQIEIVGEACDEERAVALTAKSGPDIAVIDAGLRPSGCIDLIKRLQSVESGSSNGVNSIVFDSDKSVDMVEVIMAGASGLVLGDSTGRQLSLAVEMVSAGSAIVLPAEFSGRKPWTSGDAYCGGSPGPVPDLTARENEILLMIARGLSNVEIARSLVIEEVTVRSHLHHILCKLRLRDRGQAVAFVYQMGLLHPDQYQLNSSARTTERAGRLRRPAYDGRVVRPLAQWLGFTGGDAGLSAECGTSQGAWRT